MCLFYLISWRGAKRSGCVYPTSYPGEEETVWRWLRWVCLSYLLSWKGGSRIELLSRRVGGSMEMGVPYLSYLLFWRGRNSMKVGMFIKFPNLERKQYL
jgi:hypothetical protein